MIDPAISGSQESMADRQNRLRAAFAQAADHAANVNKQAVQSSVDVGKEKTQYFEKVSLGCGATVALIVSFVGAHAGRLEPRWLLRSALVTLVLAMMFGFFRNWIFPWYVFAVWGHQDFKAKLERQLAKKELVLIGFAVSIEDGQLIDPNAWLPDSEKDEGALKAGIAKLKALEDRSFNWTQRIEYVTLMLASVGWVCWLLLLGSISEKSVTNRHQQPTTKTLNYWFLVRPERFELPTLWFEAKCSIQLSYGRIS